MSPVGETSVHSCEFFVVYVVSSFGVIEGLRIVSDWLWFSPFVSLKEDGPCRIVGGIDFEFEGLVGVGVN